MSKTCPGNKQLRVMSFLSQNSQDFQGFLAIGLKNCIIDTFVLGYRSFMAKIRQGANMQFGQNILLNETDNNSSYCYSVIWK